MLGAIVFGMWECDRFWDVGCDRCFGDIGCDRCWDVGVRSLLGCGSAIVVGMLGAIVVGMLGAIVVGMWECDRLKLGLCAIAFAKRVLCTQR